MHALRVNWKGLQKYTWYSNAAVVVDVQKSLELKELQSQGEPQVSIKPRNGSDGDSGVLVTGDENETFSTESTANGDHIRAEAGEAGPGPATVPLDTASPDEYEDHKMTSDGTDV